MIITNPSSWIEISSNAFNHNVHAYKQIIGPTKKLAVVVKSNAYGHGMREISMLCQKHQDVAWLCTTSLSEALQLRNQGITKPILVMSFINNDPAYAAQKNIDLTIYDKTTATTLNNIGKKLKKPFNVHIKVDTGMSRFGLPPHEIPSFVEYVQTLPYLSIRGIFTHFSSIEDQKFTHNQKLPFNELINQLKSNGITIPYIHSDNSAAITTVMGEKTNLVRLGAGAYGLWPSDTIKKKTEEQYPYFNLKQILTWKTRIAYIKTVPANTPVGYDKAFTTNKETTIAVLPIGYADGYNKRLVNQTQVRINNHYAPLIGNICMNALMIDISHLHNVTLGDEVILIGDYPDLTVHDMTEKIGRYNPRELTTRLHPDILRLIVP